METTLNEILKEVRALRNWDEEALKVQHDRLVLYVDALEQELVSDSNLLFKVKLAQMAACLVRETPWNTRTIETLQMLEKECRKEE